MTEAKSSAQPIKSKHAVTVKKSTDEEFAALHSAEPWTAKCSCGWESDKRTSEEFAQREAAGHLAEQGK